MYKSPLRSALELSFLYALLAVGWVLLTHIGLNQQMVAHQNYLRYDAPADTVFAVVTTVLLFLLLRRDLTAKAQVNEELRRSHDELEARVQQRTQALDAERAKLLRILDAMPDGICIINQAYEVEYINPAMRQQWGAVEQRKCFAYFEERAGPCPHCQYAKIIAGNTLRWEWSPANTQKIYEVVGTPLGEVDGVAATLHIFRNITERRIAAQEQMRLLGEIDAERTLFQTVIENAPAAIALFDGAELRVKWMNRRCKHSLPPSMQEANPVGLTLKTIFQDAASNKAIEVFHHVAASGQPQVDVESEIWSKTLGESYWQWSLVPLATSENDVPDLLLVAHDITNQVFARKRMEEMSREAEQQATELREAHIELSLRARELATLLDISRNMASTLLSRPLLETILDQLKLMIDYSTAIVYTFDGNCISIIAYRGILHQEKMLGLSIPLEQAPGFQEVLRQRVPIIVDDLQSEHSLARKLMTLSNLEVRRTLESSRSWMAIPLMINDQVLGMLRLDHLQPAFFTAHEAQIAQTIANHATLAMENARLYEDAHKVATLEERQRLARELHDSVSQALYGIALGTHAAREQLDRAPDKLGETLSYILALSATAVSEMRALVFELRPDSLEQEGLVVALSRQADAIRARVGVGMRIDLGAEPMLTLAAKEVLYRIAQEALQNIAKHAQAKNVELCLHAEASWIVLEVADDGIGFEANGRFPGHLGLQTMRERALRMGGLFEIASERGRGTRVRVQIPVAPPG